MGCCRLRVARWEAASRCHSRRRTGGSGRERMLLGDGQLLPWSSPWSRLAARPASACRSWADRRPRRLYLLTRKHHCPSRRRPPPTPCQGSHCACQRGQLQARPPRQSPWRGSLKCGRKLGRRHSSLRPRVGFSFAVEPVCLLLELGSGSEVARSCRCLRRCGLVHGRTGAGCKA